MIESHSLARWCTYSMHACIVAFIELNSEHKNDPQDAQRAHLRSVQTGDFKRKAKFLL